MVGLPFRATSARASGFQSPTLARAFFLMMATTPLPPLFNTPDFRAIEAQAWETRAVELRKLIDALHAIAYRDGCPFARVFCEELGVTADRFIVRCNREVEDTKQFCRISRG